VNTHDKVPRIRLAHFLFVPTNGACLKSLERADFPFLVRSPDRQDCDFAFLEITVSTIDAAASLCGSRCTLKILQVAQRRHNLHQRSEWFNEFQELVLARKMQKF